MEKEIIYLDTSVISAYFDLRTPNRMSITREFWHAVKNEYQLVLSDVTLTEMERTPSKERLQEMKDLVQGFRVVTTSKKTRDLAIQFIKADLVPPKKIEDALHLAIAVERSFDILVSWNFRHMVNRKTKQKLPVLSTQNGYSAKLLVDTPQIFCPGDEEEEYDLA